MSNYEKNYSVGQIRLDAPYAHFLYTLPLLSFSDAQHAIDLSLVYQSKMTDNPFNIANGYKLSLQKRLIIPENSENPTHYIENIGRKVNLFTYGSSGSEVYAFNDNSKRILRKNATGFILENSDYSREIFDTSRNVLEIIDKYGNSVLTYEYDTNHSNLVRIIYRKSLLTSAGSYKKVIDITYNSSGQMSEIKYIVDSAERCKIEFVYNSSNLITVKHYSGVNYTINGSGNSFYAYSYDDGTSYAQSIDHYQRIDCLHSNADNSITVEKRLGSKVVDRTVYYPKYLDFEDKCEVWDVEGFSGVRKRILFDGDFPKYSYEVTDVSTTSTPQYDAKFSYNDSCYYGKVSYYNNNDVVGGQCYDDGDAMNFNSSSNKWSKAFSESGGRTGLFTITGWIKPNVENTSCLFSVYNQSSAVTSEFTVKSYGTEIWTYFTHVVYGEGFTSIYVDTPLTSSALMTKDFRVTYQSVDLSSSDATKRFINAEDVLINSAGNVIPFRDVSFAYFKAGGFVTINEYVSGGDILKYLLNSKRTDAVRDEVYYNDVKDIITSATDLRVRYNGTDLNISNYTIGKRYDYNSKIYVTKLITNPIEAEAWFETQTLCNETIISIGLYDEYMNLISSTKDGVTTVYERNDVGLVTKQITNDIITEASYDETFSKLLWSKDEFGTKTTYTTNEAFGVVTNSKVTDNQNATVMEIEEAFDDDFTDRKSIMFKKGSVSNDHTLTYENDKVKTIEGGELKYIFSYEHNYTHNSTDSSGNTVSDSSDLVGISKCGSLIEQNVYKDDQRKVTTAYPSLASPLYTVVQRLDKYGRIEQIDGIVKNTYDALPFYSEYEDGEFGTVGDSGETARLAVSEDLTNGKKTKFGYDSDLLKVSCVFNSSGTKLTTERYEYDDIKRMTSDEFTYATGKTVKSDISYNTSITDASPDNRISTYSYKIDGTEKAKTQNRYNDPYKRLSSKLITVGSTTYDKSIAYEITRIKNVRDVKNGTTFHNIFYDYDALGRITDEVESVDTSFNNHYDYDSFGQLIRENNKSLDKTFVYEYNLSGNITAAKTYAYTTGNISGSHTSTNSYSYDAEQNDRLIAFNGKNISYNSAGYPISYDGWTYSWSKGKFTGISNFSSLTGRNNYTYTYDGYGRRISKKYSFMKGSQSMVTYITSANTTYTYDTSGRLIKETTVTSYNNFTSTTTENVYLYSDSGIVGMVYTANGTSSTYYFHRNIKGDVVGIYSSSGTQIAKYSYDAWGNCTISSSSNLTIAKANPFRYRGYYFDEESGFYFLNARYYNPAWRRFISPDDTAYLDPDTPNGLNLYAYCNNDPVNYADPSGNIVIPAFLTAMLIGFGVGFVLGGIFEIGKQIKTNGWDPSNWDGVQIFLSALGGGVAGAISSMMPKANYFVTFFLGGLGSVVGGLISGSVNSFETGVLAFLIGGTANIFGKFVSDQIKYFDAVEIKARSISKMSAKKKSLAIWKMLGTDKSMRNAYKDWQYELIFDVVLEQPMSQHFISSLDDLSKYMLFSSLTSVLCSGWY